MNEVGYCTLEDVRRALRKADLPGDVSQDEEIAVDAIVSQTRWLEKTLDRHYYEPDGLDEDDRGLIATDANSRDDEHDIPTHGGFVHGESERRHRHRKNSDALLEAGPRSDRRRRDRREPKREIRIATGEYRDGYNSDIPAYTRIELDRRDVQEVNELHVVNADGAFDDWVASDEYDGGVGNQFRGDDWWLRINNGGVSDLYLDVHALDDDLASLSNAVYVDIDYGREGIPRNVRRGIAFRASADFVEEAVIEIPSNATVYNVETKAEELRDQAADLLEVES